MLLFSLITKEDVPEISRIEKESFSEAWSEDAFYEALESDWHRIYCLKEKDESGALHMIGYAGFALSVPEAEITNVAVDKKLRGQGYGSILMEKLLAALKEKGADSVFLEVRAGNAPAIALYTKYGFTQIGVRKNFYRFPTEDALVMALYNKD